jgi:hypothetical protein
MQSSLRIRVINRSSLCDCDVQAVIKIALVKYRQGKEDALIPFMNVKVTIKRENDTLKIEIKDL